MKVVVVFACIVGCIYAQVTVTGRDAELKGEEKETATLGCDVQNLNDYQPMLWYRKGAQIVIDGEKYKTHTANNTLEIHNAKVEDSGLYECTLLLDSGESYNATVELKSAPYVKPFERSKNLVQDDPLSVDCHVSGFPDPTVTWSMGGADIDTKDPRFSTQALQGIANATLKIADLMMEDAGDYTCTATNMLGSSNSTVTVRVKDKLAALWPFLGICAEVVILCVIIFIYEKRRAKKMEEEDAPEESGHLANSHDHKGKDEIRQRK